MNHTVGGPRPRRSQEQITQLVAEYFTSGLGRAAFCQNHQLSLATLARYLKCAAPTAAPRAAVASFVAVEVAGATSTRECGLAFVLSGGQRLTIQRGFCAETLQQVLAVLEPR